MRVPISPYETYEVKLLPLQDALVDDERECVVESVYLGNVIALEWKA
ncbi:MAG: hypothetical protein ACJAY7_001387 [Pseudohongiellaceae bacterium]|jgi:hypothetical protein